MSASSTIDIGLRSTTSIANIFGLPCPTIDHENYCAYLDAKEIKQWCDFETKETISPETLEKYGEYYKQTINIQDHTNFQAGLLAINQLSIIIEVMRSHATNYIYTKSLECSKGKDRKNQLRKITKDYRFYFA